MRTLDRVLSVLLALVLVALGILVPIEVIRALADADPLLPYPQVADFLRERSWSAGPVIAGSAVLAGLGLVLILAELKPRRPTQLALTTDTDAVTADISRRSLARAVAHAVANTPGVESASATVGRRRIRVRARTLLRAPNGLADQARQRAQAVVDSLAPVRSLPVQCELTHRREEK